MVVWQGELLLELVVEVEVECLVGQLLLLVSHTSTVVAHNNADNHMLCAPTVHIAYTIR